MRKGSIAFRTALALVGASLCFGAVAYAAARHGPPDAASNSAERAAAPAAENGGGASPSGRSAARPPQPRITVHPTRTTTSTSARFDFDDRLKGLRFQCRLDRAGWRACKAPLALRHLAIGSHSFSVRALSRLGARSRPARFRWTLVEPRGFAIAPQPSGLSALYPGAPPVALPVVLTNPNPAAISVTSLRVSVSADPVGCDSGVNLELIPSNASDSAPIEIPAGGSIALPAGGVSPPAIRLRELPVSQDACQGVRFPLEFSGSAHG